MTTFTIQWTRLLDWTTGLTETASGGEWNSNPQSYKDTWPQGLKQCCSCTLECSFVFGVRGHMRLRTEKGTKVAGNLLHVSSYRALKHSWFNSAQNVAFLFWSYFDYVMLSRKDTRLSV